MYMYYTKDEKIISCVKVESSNPACFSRWMGRVSLHRTVLIATLLFCQPCFIFWNFFINYCTVKLADQFGFGAIVTVEAFSQIRPWPAFLATRCPPRSIIP